ncbi:Cholesterol 7-alpha-monooxygenase [Cytospora mali]|uniref:Cholesterol 7-alpha-monooxygenase n=1 Tax=Cytospora mali TaxID=578113 RepID=A0A194UNF6_CYTMA|nr:Cholesterol 7-alpha-monooxygenase [Valsa mali var. pyri (nom. inval.)]
MSSIPPVAVGVAAATYLLLVALLRFTQDAKEPTLIKDTVPFVTPIINMVSNGGAFHRLMSNADSRDKYNLPIYTLRLPDSRMYVVNSPQLITAVQAQFRTLSFTAIEATIAANLLGCKKSTIEIIGGDVTKDEGYLMSFPKYVHSALSAGPGLDAMNRRAIQVISKSLDDWSEKGATKIQMWQWVRHELLLASTEGVYGPKNPFRDPATEEAWYFSLASSPRKVSALEYMVKVWEQYFDAGSYQQGSELVKARVKINDDFHIPLMETARIEVAGSQAILTNTLPGTFWVVYHIFSDPVVLESIRNELCKVVRQDDDGTCTIDLAHVKSSCPILLSTFKETMRMYSVSTATRIAMEDHLLNNQYLLKKGSTIMMPSAVQHTNRSVWGDTVGVFDHERFAPGSKRVNPVAIRGFGGGTTLCPGRHFASTEILMFSALLVLRFELHPVDGKWTAPTIANSPMMNAMPVPDWDINVEIRPRNNKAWKVSFSGYERGMEIAAEDIEGASPDLGH